MALQANICSVMHAVNGLGFNHSGSRVFSNLSFGNNAPTSLPCLSSRNQIQHSKYNHKVLCMSAHRTTTKGSPSVKPSEAEVAEEAAFPILRPVCPYRTKVVSAKTIAGTKGAIGEICHIVLEHGGSFHFLEGQYLGVILHPLEITLHSGDAAGSVIPIDRVIIRDFSIASCRDGDCFDGRTLSLCVRRAELSLDSVSNFLCNVKEGDEVDVLGPFGETMVFPEDPKAKHIMVATSTGIAPFRSNLQRFFMDPRSKDTFKGLAWLISGTDNYNSPLYHREFTTILDKKTDYFRYQVAYNNSVGDRIYESGDEIFSLLDEGAYMYIAGSKSMKPEILEAFQQIAKERGVNWAEMLAKLKKNNQWRVEAY